MANTNTWLVSSSQSRGVVRSHHLLPLSGRHRLPLLFSSSCHLLQQQMPFLRACGQTVQLLLGLSHKRGHCAAVPQQRGHIGPASSGLALPTHLSLTSLHAAASTGLDHHSLRKHHTWSPEEYRRGLVLTSRTGERV